VLCAALAVVALLPAAVFLASAIGRSLQPTVHEPSRTLNSIVEAALALPPTVTFVLFGVLPPVAIVLAGWAVRDAVRRDAAARDDLESLAHAALRALRHPTLLASAAVALVGVGVVAILVVHAIVG
jgi:hypothetical protein